MGENIVWRVLPWRRDDAYTNMAIDKTIAESVAAGGPPTIRFYHWAGNGAVSLGASQRLIDFDTDFCEKQGIQYVRRFTGGRVMYHSPSDLTYAIAAPLSLYSRLSLGLDTSRWLKTFLETMGISDVQYAGYASSLLVNGKKISGSVPHFEAKKAILQHGSVFFTADYSLLAQIFRWPENLVRSRVTSITDALQNSNSLEDITFQFQQAFLTALPHAKMDLTEQELARVDELREYYASKEWMHSGKLSLGICSANWGFYPGLIKQLTEDLRRKYVENGSE